MGQTSIQWAHFTFNPWRGCTKVSKGCDHCYAETLSRRNPRTLGTWGPDGTRVVASEAYWALPAKWNRAARIEGVRKRVFCASLADVFEDRPELVAPRARLLSAIDGTPDLDWLLLTKRPENVMRMVGELAESRWTCMAIAADWRAGRAPRNVWVGTSTEDDEMLDLRLPRLMEVAAVLRFLSIEPMIGRLQLARAFLRHGRPDWAIFGGESGSKARATDLAWIREGRRDCAVHGVACFVKQAGAYPFDSDAMAAVEGIDGPVECDAAGVPTVKGCDTVLAAIEAARVHLVDSKGGDPLEWPVELRVREIPTVAA